MLTIVSNIICGSSNWKVLSINQGSSSNTNDDSIVVELIYEETKYLFMGDATSSVENSRSWEKVDVLKVGHHGSNSSTSQNFISQIQPTYSIISVGTNNYGHPTEAVLNILSDSKIYRTDEDHTIWLTSDGTADGIKITTLEYSLDGN